MTCLSVQLSSLQLLDNSILAKHGVEQFLRDVLKCGCAYSGPMHLPLASTLKMTFRGPVQRESAYKQVVGHVHASASMDIETNLRLTFHSARATLPGLTIWPWLWPDHMRKLGQVLGQNSEAIARVLLRQNTLCIPISWNVGRCRNGQETAKGMRSSGTR